MWGGRMKIIVREISYSRLEKVIKFFNVQKEIEFLFYAPVQEIDPTYGEEPYYIEENIKDIPTLLKKCKAHSNSVAPNLDIVEEDDFHYFWRILENIKHARVIGRQITDLEYVYEMVKHYKGLSLVCSPHLEKIGDRSEVISWKKGDVIVNIMQHRDSWEFLIDVYYKNHYVGHWRVNDADSAVQDISIVAKSKIYVVYWRGITRIKHIKEVLFDEFKAHKALLNKSRQKGIFHFMNEKGETIE